MQDLPDIPYPQLFVAYAQENTKRWQVLIGQSLTHTKYGTGIIESADNLYIGVRFFNSRQILRKFRSNSLADPQFFCDIKLPSNLEGINQTKERLQARICQEKQRRIEQEKLEEQRKIEQQKLAEQKEKEKIAVGKFLLEKYDINYLYHMTNIDNLASIIQHGLLSHNEAHIQRLVKVDISHPDVQGKRAIKRDPIYIRPLHDYVPLYFLPKNPMLYSRREIQEDIVILGLDPRLLLEPSIVFTDGNAAAGGTSFYTDILDLEHLPWDSIRSRSWTDIEDGKRIKCAEVLVHRRIGPSCIQVIFCYSHKHRETIITAKQGTLIIGKVNRDLYF